MVDYVKMQERAIKHARKPKVGDYWHECFVPILCVIDVTKFTVVTCETTKAVDSDHWTWDITKLNTYTRQQFLKKLVYSHRDDRCIGDVIPKRDKMFAKAAKELQCCNGGPVTDACEGCKQ